MKQIALLTDFGTRDPYVAAMRGVVGGRTAVPIVDLTHEIAPFDVFGAAWFLRTVWPYWGEGTIFVCVVDPGVGTSRRLLAVAEEGKIVLAPDNGLVSLVVTDQATMISIDDESLFLAGGSTTFHGRDRFAPAAAAVAEGREIASLGAPVPSIVRLPYEPPSYSPEHVSGTIVHVDHYGNAITDIEVDRIPLPRYRMQIGSRNIDRLEQTYGDAADDAFMIVGSNGTLEISIANGSAAEQLHLSRHDVVELWPIYAA